jgi:ElaB/YqjD/DUF883 family membrane-anchored ribosome-binding protein
MVSQMKTTIDIADALLREAGALAKERGTTVKAVIETALSASLRAERVGRRTRFTLKNRAFAGNGTRKGMVEGNWEELVSRAFEGRGG